MTFRHGSMPIIPEKWLKQPEILPTSLDEMHRLGWEELDVLLVSGDAYIDHPAFGVALLGRLLVAHGFRVGIVSQPDWKGISDITRLGRPRLFAGVTAGALDSMVAHYTAFRKKRSDDAYTPGGRAGARPNRACIVYANLVRQAFPGLPVIPGGIEASLRRFAHYDFWTDKLRRPLSMDSKADLVVYGMAERALLAAAHNLNREAPPKELSPAELLRGIPGTVFPCRREQALELIPDGESLLDLPSLEQMQEEPSRLVSATLAVERQVHTGGQWLTQEAGGAMVVAAPPAARLTREEMDFLYALPFSRRPHPAYREPVPAMEMIRWSITSHRGCGGGCAFCSLALHQGRRISSRSRESILKEAADFGADPKFPGSISDVGGPSANMWRAGCRSEADCRRSSCLTPRVCRHLDADQAAQLDLLRTLRETPGVRHVRVASGVRFDLALTDPETLAAFLAEFVGGQLKVAPEHIADAVLRLMRKPGLREFERFLEAFSRACAAAGKQQYVVPYLMSAHPGCTDDHMRELGRWLAERGWKPRQVQCFLPTPGTLATAMYYAGVGPDLKSVPVARSDAERLRQHAVLAPDPSPKSGRRASKETPGRHVSAGSGKRTAKRPNPSRRKR